MLYLLELGAPAPRVFFGWIVGLATLAAVVYPFSTSAPLEQKAATAIVNLILGVAIASLLSAVSARAIRISRIVPPAYGQPRPSHGIRPASSPGIRADRTPEPSWPATPGPSWLVAHSAQ